MTLYGNYNSYKSVKQEYFVGLIFLPKYLKSQFPKKVKFGMLLQILSHNIIYNNCIKHCLLCMNIHVHNIYSVIQYNSNTLNIIHHLE